MHLEKTQRFSILTNENPVENVACVKIPSIDLSRLCKSSPVNDEGLRQELLQALQSHGFVVLTLHRNSLPAQIIKHLQDTLTTDFFPDSNGPSFMASVPNKNHVYISERGVPMWRVGYEFCQEDGVREAFRVAAGWPDGVVYPTPAVRSTWIRASTLCRFICDRALQLTLRMPKLPITRPGSQSSCWKNPEYSCRSPPLVERSGDYSVLYAMHYFNKPNVPYHYDGNLQINVKQHVDPSLFVLEPFLAQESGLQVWSQGQWIPCDGPESPIHGILQEHQMGMILFVGTGFCRLLSKDNGVVQPTLHRVVASTRPRRAMIYEQKYEEFFPSPLLD